jgi:hypothetical protein
MVLYCVVFLKIKSEKNGKSKSKSSTKKPEQPTTSLREQAAAEFTRRNGEGGQQGYGSNLKAV